MALAAAFPVIGLAASIGVGLIFVTAGIVKLRHRTLLPGIIANYRLLPSALVRPVATLLPWAEILIGGALFAGMRSLAVLLGVALLGTFTLAIALNLLRGRAHINCGCGRPELSQSLSWTLVLRNLLFAAALLLRLPEGGGFDTVDIATAIAAGVSLALFTSSIGAIAASSALAAGR